jgi:enoyl-CoA hydratase
LILGLESQYLLNIKIYEEIMETQNVLLEIKNGIGYVKINRPDKLNSLNTQTIDELYEIFNKISHDDRVKAVVLTGIGEKAFIAGADISELNRLDIHSGKSFAQKGHKTLKLIENLEKPIIAAVNGFALGGGCEVALACHMRFASENAKFGQPEVNLGIIPGFGGTQRLPRLVGTGKAMELILSGNIIDAKEALRIGLVNRIYPQEDLLTAAEKMLRKIMTKGPIAVSMCIRAINKIAQLNLEQGLNYEIELFSECCATQQFKEGTSAFLEKRDPNFKNEN